MYYYKRKITQRKEPRRCCVKWIYQRAMTSTWEKWEDILTDRKEHYKTFTLLSWHRVEREKKKKSPKIWIRSQESCCSAQWIVWSAKPKKNLLESGFRLVKLQVTGRSTHKLSLEEFDGNPGWSHSRITLIIR